MSDRTSQIENLVLEVLSFYEAMTFELILMDMPEERVKQISNFNREDLESALTILLKKKKIKVVSKKSDNDKSWIKIFPKKGLLKRILTYFR